MTNLSSHKAVLFVSQTGRVQQPYMDPSTRYRCHNFACALSKRDFLTSVTSQEEFTENISKYEYFETIVFHRPQLNETLAEYLHQVKDKKRLIADFDDYIFNVEDAWQIPIYRFRNLSITQTAKIMAQNAAAAQYFRRFSLSTASLADAVRKQFSCDQVQVIHNGLDASFLGVSQIIRERMANTKRPYRFGYFSGTATHDADFAHVALALVAAMKADKESRLLVLGPAKVPHELLQFGVRVEHRQAVVPFHTLPSVMAQVETVLAPLEQNTFTWCKSGLKFFEAAAVGCSVVATPIPDIDRFQSPLLRKCVTSEDWMDALLTPFDLDELQKEQEIRRIMDMVSVDRIILDWEAAFA